MVGVIRFSVPLEPIEREVDFSEATFSVPGVFNDKTFSELTEEFVLPNFEEDLEQFFQEFFQEFEDFQDDDNTNPQSTSLSTQSNDSLLGAINVGDLSTDFDESSLNEPDNNNFEAILFNTNNPETVALNFDELNFDDFSGFLELNDELSAPELKSLNFADIELGNTI
jgi:hypothetical protein